MLNVNFRPFTSLKTERLLLREITPADVQEIFFLRSNSTVLQYLDKEPEKSLEQTLEFIKVIKDNIDTNTGILWGITLQGHNEIIGTICFWRLQKEHYRSEIGYALHPMHQNKGIMGEALQAVLQYGFNSMRLHSVEANVNPANSASSKLLVKAGFSKEAHFKENYYYNGRFIDSEIYSLLASSFNPL